MMSKLKKTPSYIRSAPAKLRVAFRCIRAPYFKWVAPGHFYSALPDMDEVMRRSETIWAPPPDTLAGIDLRSHNQAELLTHFQEYYTSPLPFERSSNPNSRFFRPNGSFPFQDAFGLYAMIRHLQPKCIIEVGCGASSCVTLDTCEALKLNTCLTFIDPYPELLLRLTRLEDRSRFDLKQAFIQDVPEELFSSLSENDILFIDTSHVSKVGSDVNHIFFNILPALKPGVVVHFHDIWYPFEYPKDWLYKGMFWNEAYLLRSFLMYNKLFEIVLFNNYLNRCMTDRIRSDFPLFLDDPGASLWIRRV
jgi:hypothetical protein